MALIDGIKAMNLEMPKRIPRTEYSLNYHYELQRAVTGVQVFADSSDAIKKEGYDKLRKAWELDFYFGTDIGNQFYNGYYTKMGHAEYAENGTDYDDDISCPFTSPEQVLDFDPIAKYGVKPHDELVAYFNKQYANKSMNNPDGINTCGTYTTYISGAIAMFGWDMFLMALGTDSEKCGQMMNRYSDYMMHYYNALAQCDSPYVLIHDDMVWTSGAFANPKWYRKYVFPNFERYIDPILKSGKKVIFCSDGNYNEFVDDIASCGFQGFIFEPMTDLNYIAKKYGQSHVIIGNADTRILLFGSKDEIKKEVERCINIGRDCPGYFMAVGNHIPANTPVDNAIYYNDCYQRLCMR